MALSLLAGFLVMGTSPVTASAASVAPAAGSITWLGQGTITVEGVRLPTTTMCDRENGAPTDGEYLLFVVASTKSITTPEITVDGSGPFTMLKANTAKKGTSSYKYVVTGDVSLTELPTVTVGFSGSGMPTITLGQGCVGPDEPDTDIWGWGFNTNGQVGDGTRTTTSTPVVVDPTGVLDGTTITAVSAGEDQTCAVASGVAYCWGNNGFGQLGVGDSVPQTNVPVAVGGALTGKTVTAVAAGLYYSCAVADGSAYCWGLNDDGQLGNGTTTQSRTPVQVSGLTNVTAISASLRHTCAVAGGVAYCWGDNLFGTLGDGSNINRWSPVAVTGFPASTVVTSVAASLYHSCALTSAGSVYCWGNNNYGQLGRSGIGSNSAEAIGGLLSGKTIVRITAGTTHTCALDSTGAAYCWGLNGTGELGDGTQTWPYQPVQVAGALTGHTIVAIAGGGYRTCAVDSTGAAYCWGTNYMGGLGDGSAVEMRAAPAAVDASGVLAGATLHGIAAGPFSYHAIVW